MSVATARSLESVVRSRVPRWTRDLVDHVDVRVEVACDRDDYDLVLTTHRGLGRSAVARRGRAPLGWHPEMRYDVDGLCDALASAMRTALTLAGLEPYERRWCWSRTGRRFLALIPRDRPAPRRPVRFVSRIRTRKVST